MGAPLRDALRRLCAEAGWNYAVFWRAIAGQNSARLIWEDGHCERMRGLSGFEAMDLLLKEQALVRNSCNDNLAELRCQTDDRVGALVHKIMVHQVHVLGNGVIGRAAVTGDHQWILRESFNDHDSISKGLAEMSHQFLAGIQTIAIIPVLPHGIVQLGSAQMVMEDIGFVNHVRCLFAHLGRVPGALLANVTRKDLSQKSQMLGMLGSNCHSENFVPQMDECMPGVARGSNNQLGKPSVAQSSCSLIQQLLEKMPPAASEMPLVKQTITNTEMPLSHRVRPMTQPGTKPIFHLNNQLEGGDLGSQVLIPNSSVMSIQQALPYGSGSEVKGQSSLVTSGLSSSGLRFLEEQLVPISDCKSQASNKFSEPSLNDTKAVQLGSGCFFSASLQDLDVGPLIGKVESMRNVNGIGRSSTLLGGSIEALKVPYPGLPIGGAVQLSKQTNHSNGYQVISTDSYLGNPSSISCSSQSALDAGKHEKKDDLVKALGSLATKFDTPGSCYRLLSGSPHDCRLIDDTSTLLQSQDEEVSPFFLHPTSENDLFDVVGLDVRRDHFGGSSNNMFRPRDVTDSHESGTEVSTCINQMDVGPVIDSVDYDISCSGVFLETDPDQLLDAVVSKVSFGVKHSPDDSLSCKTSLTKISSSSLHGCSPTYGGVVPSQQKQGEFLGLPPMPLKKETAGSTSVKSEDCSLKQGEFLGLPPMPLKKETTGSTSVKTEDCSQKSGGYKSQISLWVETGQNLQCNHMSALDCKRVDEIGKLNRKRARPGENPRPRPKDRQMIQDRVKELREIVPNGAKCSIDALLEKTIKHMLFLQSVTKHADKLKESGEPKIISKDGGLLLKDNFEGGATWAFEVGTQSMICPIIVEDLNPPRQMLVEMLCEERGFFLEIADLIRGLGLTILKGVMEARKNKVWARFAVEANRDVTRMEIFLSLVQLLEPTGGSSLKPQGMDSITMPHMFHQPSIPATGSSDHLL